MNFLKTGFDLVDEEKGMDADFMRNITSILKVFMKQALETSIHIAQVCGRTSANEFDLVLALKYECHEFLDRELEERVVESYQEELNHTYLTDDEETDEETN